MKNVFLGSCGREQRIKALAVSIFIILVFAVYSSEVFATSSFELGLNLPRLKTTPVNSNCAQVLLNSQSVEHFNLRVRELLSISIPAEHLSIFSHKWAELQGRSLHAGWATLQEKIADGSASSNEMQMIEKINQDRSTPSGTLSGSGYANLLGAKENNIDIEKREIANSNWKAAEQQVFKWARAAVQPNKEGILKLHSTLIGKASRFRIAGEDVSVIYPFNKMTIGEMVASEFDELFLSWYDANKNQLHPILLASNVLRRFVTIHPFADANGRTGRLLMDWILQLHGYPPPTFPSVHGSRMKSAEPVFASRPDNGTYNPSSLVEIVTLGIQNTIESLEKDGLVIEKDPR